MNRVAWAAVIAGALFLAGCVVSPPHGAADDPEGVRLQYADTPTPGKCIIATHDTMQGASVAIWCNNK